jgi:serine/threonine protein phosphatase 1
MFKRLFSRSVPQRAVQASVPPGERIYAIGDIHGCDEQLAELLGRIERDESDREGKPSQLIFLGDLVDRGPKSAQVVQRLIDLDANRGHCRFLTGNHEEIFLRALSGDPKMLKFFVRIGGEQTLKSYGIGDDEYRQLDFEALLHRARRLVPREHLDFVGSFEDLIQIGDYIFVHAGIRPHVALSEQKPTDLRWIRDEFLDASDTGIDGVIVHGHTIAARVELNANRIGIDTGAYADGPLTALGLEGTRRWVVQTGG